jgi:glutathione S-transferase
MIRLYGFSPLWGLSDLSPFVMKVEVYLRLTKIPYETVPFSGEAFFQAPKGKYPCIVDGNEKIADSNFIIDHLKKKYGNTLDAKLGPTERAAGHAIKRMLEENLYWVLVAERWRDTNAAAENYSTFAGAPAELVQAVTDKMIGDLNGQGMGRHTQDEIEDIGNRDLEALANVVADNEYLLGSEPSSYDATAYAFVAHVIQPDYDSRMKRFITRLPNLMGYWDRFTRRHYKARSR